MTLDPDKTIVLTEAELRKRRQRNVAIALALAGLAVLFWVVTLVKGPVVLNRSL
ncbi:MAG: CoxF protein [Alphaproteobacteria bacterium]|jgi:hypothetical protein